MRDKRVRSLHTIIILLTVTTLTSLTFAGTVGVLYVKEAREVHRLQAGSGQQQTGQALPALSADVTGSSTQQGIMNMENADVSAGPAGEAATAGDNGTEQTDAEGVPGLTQSEENEIEQLIKNRMKELVTSEDGSPLKMLRSFFPENLIYYFEDQYLFVPVLDDVNKHGFLEENFVRTEDGQMQYVENGTAVSHKGIDVSKYQGSIDWAQVREDGVEYAFIRVGLRGYESGRIVPDERFEDNIKGANGAGIQAGVYFFTQAVTVEEAVEEAAFVLQSIAPYDVSCPVVLDVERITKGKGRADALTQAERTDIAIAFCEAVKAAGYTPMIYGNIICFTQMLDMTRLNGYEKWYAFYDDYMYMPYEVSCWQYSENGRVKGIGQEVDMNISFKQW